MPQAGFEPTIPASGRPKIHALDRLTIGFGCSCCYLNNNITLYIHIRICIHMYVHLHTKNCFIIRYDTQLVVNHQQVSPFHRHFHGGIQECAFIHSQQTATGDTGSLLCIFMVWCRINPELFLQLHTSNIIIISIIIIIKEHCRIRSKFKFLFQSEKSSFTKMRTHR